MQDEYIHTHKHLFKKKHAQKNKHFSNYDVSSRGQIKYLYGKFQVYKNFPFEMKQTNK